MFDFNEPVLADKAKADAIFYACNYRTDDYCFGNLFIWRKRNKIKIAFTDEMILVGFEIENNPWYLYPAGNGDKRAVMKELAVQAKLLHKPLKFAGVTPAIKNEMDELFPDQFEIVEERANYDYIYHSTDLINLAGRKYHSKRNHITRFKAAGNWSYENITSDNIEECRLMNEEWCRQNSCNTDESLKDEYCAVRYAFNNFDALGFLGGLIRLDGRVVAFTIGEKLCCDTFDIHIEKAFSSVEGAYPVINNEFAAHNCSTYVYINREEDMGQEGLRKAKLSYNPGILLQKDIAIFKDGALI